MSAYRAQFHLRRASADRSGYYVTRWDRAVPMVIIAGTKQEAINKADALSGEPNRGRYWTFKVDRIEEILEPSESENKE